MSDDGTRDDGDQSLREPARLVKKQWVKPAFLREVIFEAAAGCGKADASQVICLRLPSGGS